VLSKVLKLSVEGLSRDLWHKGTRLSPMFRILRPQPHEAEGFRVGRVKALLGNRDRSCEKGRC